MAIPNTTPTPNELYNGEMLKMTDTELRVVLIVTRATLGWVIDKRTGMRKQEDWISQKKLMEKSGRSNRAISTAIDNAIKKGWVEARNKKGDLLDTPKKRERQRVYYRLGYVFLDRISGEDSSSDKKPSGEVNDKHLVNITTPSGEDSSLYKRNYTKETNTKVYRGFQPPTHKEVSSYCKERKNKVDAERFIDFYSAKGWYIGKNKMKDWKAAVRTWERKIKEPQPLNFKRPALIVASELKASQYSKEEIQAEMIGKYTEAEVGGALERLF